MFMAERDVMYLCFYWNTLYVCSHGIIELNLWLHSVNMVAGVLHTLKFSKYEGVLFKKKKISY